MQLKWLLHERFLTEEVGAHALDTRSREAPEDPQRRLRGALHDLWGHLKPSLRKFSDMKRNS